jgi:hypothetical protein
MTCGSITTVLSDSKARVEQEPTPEQRHKFERLLRVLFWKGPVNFTSDRVDVRANPDVPTLLLPALARFGRAPAVIFASVEERKRGLVYLDGR